MTQGVHPFPYRTRKLSPVVPKIVGWRRPVKIGRCQHLYSSIAQSVERMTVNHDVTGSSPVGGAKTESRPNGLLFVLPNRVRKAEIENGTVCLDILFL